MIILDLRWAQCNHKRPHGGTQECELDKGSVTTEAEAAVRRFGVPKAEKEPEVRERRWSRGNRKAGKQVLLWSLQEECSLTHTWILAS